MYPAIIVPMKPMQRDAACLIGDGNSLKLVGIVCILRMVKANMTTTELNLGTAWLLNIYQER